MKTLRLLQLVVQPVFVYDEDGELKPGPQVQPLHAHLSNIGEIEAQIKAFVEQHNALTPA